MEISVKTNVKDVSRTLNRIQRKQIPYATSVAINRTIDKVKDDEQRGMRRYLDRPTKQTINSLFIKYSHKKRLAARLFFTDWANRYISLQVYGGTRNVNNVVVPLNRYGGALNAYGNIPARKNRGWARKRKQFFAESKGKTLLLRPKGRDDQVVVGVMASNTQYKKRYPFHEIARRSVSKHFDRFFGRALKGALRSAR